MNYLLTLILILFILIFNTSCTERITYSGKIFEDNTIQYKNYINKNEIINNLGMPDYIDPIENKYYYFSEKRIYKNFFDKSIENRILIVFNFNKDDTVKNSFNYNLENEKQLKVLNDSTDNQIIKQGLLKKVFGGVGKSTIPTTQ